MLSKSSLFGFLFLFIGFFAAAQRTAIGVKLGAANYQGDLVPTAVNISQSHLAAGFFFRKNLNDRFAIRFAADFGTISGDDKLYADRLARGLSFKSKIFSASINAQWNLLNRSRFDKNGEFRKGFSPFLMSGLGAVMFDPKTKGLGLDAPEQAELGMRYNFLIPMGVGIQYEMSPKMTFGLEATTHVPFTDYLDGVSESAKPGNRDWFGLVTLTAQYWIDKPVRERKTEPSKKEEKKD